VAEVAYLIGMMLVVLITRYTLLNARLTPLGEMVVGIVSVLAILVILGMLLVSIARG